MVGQELLFQPLLSNKAPYIRPSAAVHIMDQRLSLPSESDYWARMWETWQVRRCHAP